MGGRKKEPIALLVHKGKAKLSKEEIKKRFEAEAAAKGKQDRIIAPDWLTEDQQDEFYDIATELLRLDLMSNLDCDTLAMYVDMKSRYVVNKQTLDGMPSAFSKVDSSTGEITYNVNTNYSRLQRVQIELTGKIRSIAGEMGLSLNSRLKMVIPKVEEKPKSKFSKFGGA